MELQIEQWIDKHDKLGKETKEMQVQLRESSVLQSMFDTLKAEKDSVVSQQSTTLEKMAQLTAHMEQVRLDLKLEKEKNEVLEAKQTEVTNSQELPDLKAQIVALKAQLAKAMHTRQLSPMKPTSNGSRNLSPSNNNNNRHLFADESYSESQDSIKPLRDNGNVLTNRKTRRNSSAETTGNIPKTSIDQIRKAEELGGRNPRPTSVGQSNTIAGGKSSRLDVITDNPEEEVTYTLICLSYRSCYNHLFILDQFYSSTRGTAPRGSTRRSY